MLVFLKEDDPEVCQMTGHCSHRKKLGGLRRRSCLFVFYHENCACFVVMGRKGLMIHKLWQNGIQKQISKFSEQDMRGPEMPLIHKVKECCAV